MEAIMNDSYDEEEEEEEDEDEEEEPPTKRKKTRNSSRMPPGYDENDNPIDPSNPIAWATRAADAAANTPLSCLSNDALAFSQGTHDSITHSGAAKVHEIVGASHKALAQQIGGQRGIPGVDEDLGQKYADSAT
jgi:hypothetical protein